jgi:hypothetical protein
MDACRRIWVGIRSCGSAPGDDQGMALSIRMIGKKPRNVSGYGGTMIILGGAAWLSNAREIHLSSSASRPHYA